MFKHLLNILIVFCAVPNLVMASNWLVEEGLDPVSRKPMCLLTSAEKVVADGQGETPVKIMFNGNTFLIYTKSNIDLSYPGVGLQVDKQGRLEFTKTFKETHVLIEENVEEITTLFVKGLQAKVYLGFWPTWPVSDTKEVAFSLVGFTDAYTQFRRCAEG